MAESKINIDVTLLIRGKQRLYSVPNGEFLRYAQYCTRRISRLTKLMRKEANATETKGPKLNLDPAINQNTEHIQIAIYTAERAWARYRYLKNSAEGNKRNAHAFRRLVKCQKAWQLAHDCAVAFCTEKTKLEIEAFQAYAKATLELEKGEWENAYRTFNQVSEVFGLIMESSTNPTLIEHCEDIRKDIEPLLEFCKFNLGQTTNSHIDAELREKVKDTFSIDTEKTTAARQISKLNWNGKTIPIVHDGLKQKLAVVCDLIEDSYKEGLDDDFRLGLYDKIIAQTHSVSQLVKSLSQKTESEDLKSIDEYLKWNSFISTISRSQTLLSSLGTMQKRQILQHVHYQEFKKLKNKTAYIVMTQLFNVMKEYGVHKKL